MKIEVQNREDGPTHCVYCRDDLPSGEGLSCPECSASFHPDCREQLNGCTTPGCTGLTAGKRRPDVPVARERRIPHEAPDLFTDDWVEWLMAQDPMTRAYRVAAPVGLSCLVMGVVIGFCYGGIIVPRHGFSVGDAIKYSLGGFPLALAGAAYGFLQGLVGLRVPQPRGGGALTMAVVVIVGLVTALKLGPPPAVVLSVATSLLCGRLFGFHFPKKTGY